MYRKNLSYKRRCSNYIFILDLTSGFKGFGKDSRKTVQESFECWDSVRLILETWRQVMLGKLSVLAISYQIWADGPTLLQTLITVPADFTSTACDWKLSGRLFSTMVDLFPAKFFTNHRFKNICEPNHQMDDEISLDIMALWELTHLPLDKMAVISADDNLKCIFLNENDRILIRISLKFIPKSAIDSKPALVQVMAWRQIGAKPLPESMLIRFSDAYMWH